MLNRSLRILSILTCLLTSLLISCSSSPGGGGIAGTGKSDIITVGSGVVIGPIDGFGSIIINDRRFTTDEAEVFIDGFPAQFSDLQVGMQVSARVDNDARSASTILYQPLVVGPILQIPPDGESMVVLNEQIRTTPETVFDGISPSAIQPNMIVEISGVRNSDNNIVASYIRPTSVERNYYSVGILEDFNSETFLATISGSTIDFGNFFSSLGTTIEDFSAMFLQTGALLKSEFDPERFEQELLIATSLEAPSASPGTEAPNDNRDAVVHEVVGLNRVNRLEVSIGDSVQVAGIATRVESDNTFVINGRKVIVSEFTVGTTLLGSNIENFIVQENEAVIVTGVTIGNASIIETNINTEGTENSNSDSDFGNLDLIGFIGTIDANGNISANGTSLTNGVDGEASENITNVSTGAEGEDGVRRQLTCPVRRQLT